MAICTSALPLLCPRSSGPEQQEGRQGVHPFGEASTRPDQVTGPAGLWEHFTSTR